MDTQTTMDSTKAAYRDDAMLAVHMNTGATLSAAKMPAAPAPAAAVEAEQLDRDPVRASGDADSVNATYGDSTVTPDAVVPRAGTPEKSSSSAAAPELSPIARRLLQMRHDAPNGAHATCSDAADMQPEGRLERASRDAAQQQGGGSRGGARNEALRASHYSVAPADGGVGVANTGTASSYGAHAHACLLYTSPSPRD